MILPVGFLSPFRTTVSLQSSLKTLVQGMGMVDSTFTVFSGPPSSTFILSCDTWNQTFVPMIFKVMQRYNIDTTAIQQFNIKATIQQKIQQWYKIVLP